MIITLVGAGAATIQSVPAIFKGDPGDGGSGGTVTWDNIPNKPVTFTPSAHTHAITDVTGLQAALDGKASTTHTHTYDSITGKPATFTPAAHTHAISEVTGLQTALDGKASTSHTHPINEVTGLQTALDGKQPTTTFKTINNESIVGTGNIVVEGGTGSDVGTHKLIGPSDTVPSGWSVISTFDAGGVTLRVITTTPELQPIDAVVVIGASIMNSMFGKNLTTPHNTATNLLAAEGHNLPVYGWATGSTTLADADEHYLEARAAFPNALIVMHFGGNDVSSFRPYPGGLATIESRLAALLAVTQGDTRFYPASLTFRDYDDTTFQNPDNGSRPYNENVLIPWIAANFPHAMANYGRPKLDFYRRVLADFESWLSADNVHLSGTGTTQFRAWLIGRVADLLEDITPPLIEERVYTAPPVDPDPEPEPEPGTYPLSIVNMTMYDSQIPYNNFQVETTGSIPPINIFDVEGVSTGISGQITFTPPETAVGFDIPGRGRNSNGRVLGLSAYNKSLLCTEVVRNSLYLTASVVGTITLTGCVPNAQYEIGVIGSREATNVRNTVLNINGTTLTWDTSETTVQVRTATVTATAGGVITMTMSCGASTTFAYLNGFSLRRVS